MLEETKQRTRELVGGLEQVIEHLEAARDLYTHSPAMPRKRIGDLLTEMVQGLADDMGTGGLYEVKVIRIRPGQRGKPKSKATTTAKRRKAA